MSSKSCHPDSWNGPLTCRDAGQGPSSCLIRARDVRYRPAKWPVSAPYTPAMTCARISPARPEAPRHRIAGSDVCAEHRGGDEPLRAGRIVREWTLRRPWVPLWVLMAGCGSVQALLGTRSRLRPPCSELICSLSFSTMPSLGCTPRSRTRAAQSPLTNVANRRGTQPARPSQGWLGASGGGDRARRR